MKLCFPICDTQSYIDVAYYGNSFSPSRQASFTPHNRKLLDQVRDVIRLKHFSYRTEEAYIAWVRRFILFHGKRHPREMGAQEVCDFLTYLAAERDAAASTQNQALNALVFLYSQVLRCPLGNIGDWLRSKRPKTGMAND